VLIGDGEAPYLPDPRYDDLHRTPRQNDAGSVVVAAHPTVHQCR
jgi:hypothetical protein